MKRGSLCWVNLEPSSPPEFGKTRPCLIISNTEQNYILPTVVVIPISSKAKEIWPLRIKISSLNKELYAVMPGIRQISKSRIMDKIYDLSEDDIKKVDEALMVYLSE